MKDAAIGAGGGGTHGTTGRPNPDVAVFALLYERGPAWIEGRDVPEQPGIAEHRQYLGEHSAQIVANGPLVFESADSVVGLLVLQAGALAEAERFITEDPGVRSRVFRATARRWRLNRFRALEVAAPIQR